MTRNATLSAEALVASLRAIADHSFDSIMITRAGKESAILYVNKAFTALTGYSAKSVIGKSPVLLQCCVLLASALQSAGLRGTCNAQNTRGTC